MQGAKKKDQKTQWQRDIFIFRFRENKDQDMPGQVKVLQNKQFLELLVKSKSDKNWANIELIQTCIKADGGCGDPVIIHFYADINEANPSEEINYKKYKDMEDDYTLLARGEDKLYVKKQCLKYCYYAQKVHGKEILQMKAEFFKDTNGKIWFFYARGIQCRTNTNTKALNCDDAKK